MITRRTLFGVLASLPLVGAALAKGTEPVSISEHNSPFANDPSLIPIPEDHVSADGGYGEDWRPLTSPLANMVEIEFMDRYSLVQSDWDSDKKRCYWAWKIRRGVFIRIPYCSFGRCGVFADPADKSIHRYSDIVLWRFASEPHQFDSLEIEQDEQTGLPIGYEFGYELGLFGALPGRRKSPRGRQFDTHEKLTNARYNRKQQEKDMNARYDIIRRENNKRRAGLI